MFGRRLCIPKPSTRIALVSRALRVSRCKVFAWGKKSTQQTRQVAPSPSRSLAPGNQPWLKVGIAVLAAAAVLQLAKKVSSRGSLGSLETRGLMAEGEHTVRSNDPFYSKMMRNVNTVQYEELTPEQIDAARKRRSQDRRNNEKVDLSKIQLPANHPFAVSKELTQEEEALQMARLNVRRGMPLKDMNELKVRQVSSSSHRNDEGLAGITVDNAQSSVAAALSPTSKLPRAPNAT